jgi:hypothetical protein
MLNGIDPILIFKFSKLITDPKNAANKSKIPITASILSKLPLPAIPIYLSEKLTGIYIDTEEKNIDIDTSTETLQIADDPILNQRGINNTVKISMMASRSSIGLTLLSAMADYIFPKVTSREYSITYLHGAITVFDGLLHSFAITQDPNTDKYNITLELIRPGIQPKTLSTEVNATKGVQLDPTKVPGT